MSHGQSRLCRVPMFLSPCLLFSTQLALKQAEEVTEPGTLGQPSLPVPTRLAAAASSSTRFSGHLPFPHAQTYPRRVAPCQFYARGPWLGHWSCGCLTSSCGEAARGWLGAPPGPTSFLFSNSLSGPALLSPGRSAPPPPGPLGWGTLET